MTKLRAQIWLNYLSGSYGVKRHLGKWRKKIMKGGCYSNSNSILLILKMYGHILNVPSELIGYNKLRSIDETFSRLIKARSITIRVLHFSHHPLWVHPKSSPIPSQPDQITMKELSQDLCSNSFDNIKGKA